MVKIPAFAYIADLTPVISSTVSRQIPIGYYWRYLSIYIPGSIFNGNCYLSVNSSGSPANPATTSTIDTKTGSIIHDIEITPSMAGAKLEFYDVRERFVVATANGTYAATGRLIINGVVAPCAP